MAELPLTNWDDLLLLEDQLDEQEQLVRDTAQDYCQARLRRVC